MYIYRNKSGIQLTTNEFKEILNSDLLQDVISIIICVDSELLVEEVEETDDEKIERISRSFLK